MDKTQNKHRKLPQRLLAFVLTIACFLTYNYETSALLISNGTASSGGSGNSASSGTGSYGLPAFVNNDYIKAPAYRFTVVDGNGNTICAPADVYKQAYSKYMSTSYHKLEIKYSKIELKNIYTSSATLNSGAVKNDCYIDSNLGLSLPADTTVMANSWSLTPGYINALMQKLWGKNVDDLANTGYYLLIEPIYPVTIKGQNHSLTVTEMAVYGANEFGANTVPPSSGDQNSWAWISNYTNKLYPNALRLKNTEAGLSAPTELTSRASFATIIENGYGAMTVSAKNLGATTKPLNPPDIKKWTYIQDGSNGFAIYIDVDNADSLQVPVWTELGGQDDLIWYDAYKTSGTPIGGHSYNWFVDVDFADHNDELGKYITHFYAFNSDGSDVDAGEFTPVSSAPKLVAYRAHQTGTGYEGFTVYLKIENADYVSQSTFMTQELSLSEPELGKNIATPIAGSYVLDGVEYNYKFSVSFNEFVSSYIGEYSTRVRMFNTAYGSRSQTISYTFGYNNKGTAEASKDGKGFYVYANSVNTNSFVFGVEDNYGHVRNYTGEEGLNKNGYRFSAFVPYDDFGGAVNFYENTKFTINMFAGNDYTFKINSDNTTTIRQSIHNPPSDYGNRNSYFPVDIFEFEPKSYTITYHTNHGTAPASQQKIQYVDLTLSSAVPIYEGHVFSGWSTPTHTYWPGETYAQDEDLALYAEWIPKDAFGAAGTEEVTIRVGDEFNPDDYLDVFDFPEDKEMKYYEVLEANIPLTSENKATTVGSYTVLYAVGFENSYTISGYQLTVHVIEPSNIEQGKGVIRFISSRYLHTLHSNSKWKQEPLWGTLKSALSKDLTDTSTCQQVWYFSAEDYENKVRPWCLSHSKGSETNKSFLQEFGDRRRIPEP